MQRSLFYLWLIFVIVGSGVSCSQEPADESTDKAAESADEAVIRDIMEKYTQSWKEPNPGKVCHEILSDKAFVYTQYTPYQAQIFNKQSTIALYRQVEMPQDLRYEIHTIKVFGPLAYEVGTLDFTTASGEQRRGESLHFLAKDETGWKVIGTFPAKAVRIALAKKSSPKRTSEDASQMKKDEVVIRNLIKEVNRAWQSMEGLLIMKTILSDKSYAHAIPRSGNPAEALIINKARFGELFREKMKNKPPKKHEHRIQSVTLGGPMAYEIGTSIHQEKGGIPREDNILNIFAKDESGWKMIFSANAAHVRKALQAADNQKPMLSDDEKNLRQIAQRFVHIFRSENPTPFEWLNEILTEDFFVVCSDGRLLPDKLTTLREYRKGLDEIRQELNSLQIKFDIHFVRVFKETACVFGKIRMEGRVKESGEAFHRHIWETLIFRKVNGQWKLCQEHSTRAHTNPGQP